MRLSVVVMALALLGGCAAQQAKEAGSLDDLNLSNKDGVCARQCLDTYSSCTRRSGETASVFVQANLLTACKASVKACVQTCPNVK